MPVYNVTGKLGGGKTLFAVQQAFERLQKGLIVAANIDLFPEAVLPPWYDQKRVRLFRVPDRPGRTDLDALGTGNETSDETKNGLLILDECGTMLNSRNFKDAGRQELIDWFLHARKLGWDIMFISQSHGMIDKQIRDALIEYLVVVRRFDRYRVPLLTWLGIKINMPRIHFAIVRYGNTPQAMVSERIFFRGNNLFNGYSTRQLLLDDGSGRRGVYQVLPPYLLKGRFMTKIQIARVAARGAWAGGLALGILLSFLWFKWNGYAKPEPVSTEAVQTIDQLPLASLIRRPDGRVLVVKPDGTTEHAKELKADLSGQIVTTYSGQKFRTQP